MEPLDLYDYSGSGNLSYYSSNYSYDYTMWSNGSADDQMGLISQPLHLLIIYCITYLVVFLLGLVGNIFVLVAVIRNPNMRNITNYFITSLAVADLLIIVFCLPATLMNNILREWLLGNFLCKLSVWINGTTVCASVYTLVAVSADRYFAICHPLRYGTWERRKTFYVICPVWVFSGVLFSPYLIYYEDMSYEWTNTTTIRICYHKFPSQESERLFFLVVNFIVAFIVPLAGITVCYVYIFSKIFGRQKFAVDRKANERDHSIRMKVTNMLIIVVLLFALSWLPLYIFATYLTFAQLDVSSYSFRILMTVLKPIFQWLSLSNSCINPLLYAYFSSKFRKEFLNIILIPSRRRFQQFKTYSRNTMKRYRPNSISKILHSRAGSFCDPDVPDNPDNLHRGSNASSYKLENSGDWRGGSQRSAVQKLSRSQLLPPSTGIPVESEFRRNYLAGNNCRWKRGISPPPADTIENRFSIEVPIVNGANSRKSNKIRVITEIQCVSSL